MRAAMALESQKIRLSPRKPASSRGEQYMTSDIEHSVSSATCTSTYDANESIFTVVMRYKGTLLPMVLSKPLFWLMIISNTCLLIWNDWLVAKHGEGLPVLEWDAAGVPMSLLVFFIVFYGQQAYQRYYQYYSHLTGMTTALMEYMSMVRRHFGDNPVGALNAARLLLASQYYASGT